MKTPICCPGYASDLFGMSAVPPLAPQKTMSFPK